MAANVFDQFDQQAANPFDQFDAPVAQKPEKTGMLRAAADIPVQVGRGVAVGVKALSDVFGADNPVSRAASGVEDFLGGLLSAQAKNDQAEIARIMKEAQDKGVGDQVTAAVKAFATAPVDMLSQALGTAVPVIAGGLAGSVARLGAMGVGAIGTGVGAAMGAGTIKGQIYDAVKQELLANKVPEAEAEKRAQEAQAYGGKNLDQILMGAGIGAAEAAFGAERILTGLLRKGAVKPSALPAKYRIPTAAATEAVPEMAQAAQEQVAQNIALQREGYDVPTMRGVVGQAALEGIAGMGLGAITGAVQRTEAAKPQAPAGPQQAEAEALKSVTGEAGIVRPEEEVKPLTPEEQRELELQQRLYRSQQPKAEELLGEVRGQVQTAPPTTPADIARIRDDHETAVINSLLEQDRKMQSVADLARLNLERMSQTESMEAATQDADRRVREGRLMGRVQSLIDLNIPFASTAIADINRKFEMIGEAPLDDSERSRVQNIMTMAQGFTDFVKLPSLPAREQDIFAENQAMQELESSYKEQLQKRLQQEADRQAQLSNKKKQATTQAVLQSIQKRGGIASIDEAEYLQSQGIEGAFADVDPGLGETISVTSKGMEEEISPEEMSYRLAQLKERKPRGQVSPQPVRTEAPAPSPVVGQAPVSGRVEEGAAVRPTVSPEPSIAEDRQRAEPVVEAAAPEPVVTEAEVAGMEGEAALGAMQQPAVEAPVAPKPSVAEGGGRATVSDEEAGVKKSLRATPDQQVRDFEQTLRTALNKFGLKDVGVKLIGGMREEGSYAQQLIRIAADSANPIRTLRHEAIHALRELGFFTPQQWKSLSKMAKDKWIDQYLKKRNVDGKPLKAGEESRYDAYMREYEGDMEKITEEAVADAFADFDATKPPSGLMSSLLTRLRNLFQAIKSALTNVESPEQIFGRVERGELAAGAPEKSKEAKSLRDRATANFLRWFGDSKVVDENGDPLVFYHGGDPDFTGIRAGGRFGGAIFVRQGSPSGYGKKQHALYVKGPILELDEMADLLSSERGREVLEKAAHRSLNEDEVDILAEALTDGSDYPTNEDVWNLIGAIDEADAQLETQKLRGAVARELGFQSVRTPDEFDGETVMVLSPTQIKSATDNNGEYSLTDADIRKSLRKEEPRPTPTTAGQSALNTINQLGMGVKQPEGNLYEQAKKKFKAMGESPAGTKAEIKEAVRKFFANIETKTMSSDARWDSDIKNGLRQDMKPVEDIIGASLLASQSQAVGADAVSTRAMLIGGATYDEKAMKWVAYENKDANEVVKAKVLDEIAAKYGLTKEEASQVAHTYLVAANYEGIIKRNAKLEEQIKKARLEAKEQEASLPKVITRYQNEIEQLRKLGDDKKANEVEREFNSLNKQVREDIAKFRNEADDLEAALVFVSENQAAMVEPGKSIADTIQEVKKIAKIWNEQRRMVKDAMVFSGLWRPEYADAMMDNAAYVPFYRETQIDADEGPRIFMRGLQVKAKEHKLKGSETAVNNVFENMAMWQQYAMNRAIRNHKAVQSIDVGKTIQVGDRKMAEQVKEPKRGMNVVKIWREGKQEFYEVADPYYVEAFQTLGAVYIEPIKYFTAISNILRKTVVMYPLFSIGQLTQDSVAAIFASGLKPQYAFKIPYLAVKEFGKTMMGWSTTHEELKNYGAVGVRDFNAAVAREDAAITAGVKAPRGAWGKINYMLERVAMSADNAVRQAMYIAATEAKLSKAEALEKAFEIINFRRRGSSKMLQLMGQTVPFFYAYLSAQRVAYKTLTGTGISPTERMAALETLAQTTAAVMALSFIYAMANGDDEEYKKTPSTIRDRSLMIPGSGGVRIPLRPDFFLFPKVIAEHTYQLLTDEGYSDGAKMRKSMADLLANATLSPNAVPQLIKPTFEAAINYSFFEGKPIVGFFEQNKEAGRQFNDSTSEMAKWFGQFGASPQMVDHLIRGYFGSVGGLTLWGTNFFIEGEPGVPRPEITAHDMFVTMPGVGAFKQKPTENALKVDFYELRDAIAKVKNTYDDMKVRSPEGLEAFIQDEKNLARLAMDKQITKIGDHLSKIRRAIQQVAAAPESRMSASEKQERIKELRDVEMDLLKAVDVKALRAQAKL